MCYIALGWFICYYHQMIHSEIPGKNEESDTPEESREQQVNVQGIENFHDRIESVTETDTQKLERLRKKE